MAREGKKRGSTRWQILRLAARYFIEIGYSKTSLSRIAKELGLSTGNITFYFPTKEHLLAVLVDELHGFHSIRVDRCAAEGRSSLLSYCLELAVIAAACNESDAARDFYSSCYASPLTLELIRKKDTERTMDIFGAYQPKWKKQQWVVTENLVSGLEYATLTTRENNTPLHMQIEKSLDAILYLYGVPEDIRVQKIKQVLEMDYRATGRIMLGEFKEYIARLNDEELEKAEEDALLALR